MKKQLLLLSLIAGLNTLQAENVNSPEKCVIEDNLVDPVENIDFNETLFMLQREKRHGANHDKALQIINKIIQEKKQPVSWYKNYRGLTKTVVGSLCSLAGIIGVSKSHDLANSKAGYVDIFTIPLALGGFIASSLAITLGFLGLRSGMKELSLSYHRDYPKALAIKALLDSYKDQIIYCK